MLLVVIFAIVVLYCLWQLQPGRMERKGPNALVGMRSATTVSSTTAWAAAHRAAWPTVRKGCLAALVALGTAALSVTWAPDELHWEVGAVGVGIATAILLALFVRAHRKADRAASRTSKGA